MASQAHLAYTQRELCDITNVRDEGRVLAGERILVADDSRENREFIIDYILKPNHFQPIESRDGMETLDLVRRQHPDLILLDLQMPRLDGRGVLEALQRENLNVPVILMTFHGSEEIAVEMFRLGVRDYVKKPYTPEEMLTAIDSCLTEQRLRKEKEALTQRLLHANRELHNRVKELNALYSIGKSVTGLMNLPQLLARIVEAATVVTAAEEGRLLLLEGNQIVQRAVKRHNDEHARPTAEVVQDGIAERAIQSGQPVTFTAEDMAAKRQRNPGLPMAMMMIPLMVGGRVIGTLGVNNINNGTKSFSDHDNALLSALGDYAAIAIENARNYQQADANRNSAASPASVPPSRQHATVMLAELRGGALYSADASATAHLGDILNDYLTVAAEAISMREGSVVQSYGDGVVAIFGNPARAVGAAQALQSGAASLNAAHGINVGFAVGVTMGDVVLGTLGGSMTAVGNAVILARRLVELAEPGQILVEELSSRLVSKENKLASLGRQKLKGIHPLIEIFAVK
jgi:DNA-binding response OmpR family regulator/class 3 adenylate cyclase